MYRICINAGHDPQKDFGCCYNNLHECDITKSVGEAVVTELLKRGYDAKFVQNDDLDYVCDFANGMQANLFVALHCDAFDNPTACGTTAYWYRDSRASVAGNAIRDNICKAIGTCNRDYIHDCNFYVCKYTAMPATLIEMFFLSNKEDTKKYQTHFDELVNAICNGIDVYFQ